MTTNAVSKTIQIPTRAAVEAFFVARMAWHSSPTVRVRANAARRPRTEDQFFAAKKASSDPLAIRTESLELKQAEQFEDDDDNDNDSDDVENISVHAP